MRSCVTRVVPTPATALEAMRVPVSFEAEMRDRTYLLVDKGTLRRMILPVCFLCGMVFYRFSIYFKMHDPSNAAKELSYILHVS